MKPAFPVSTANPTQNPIRMFQSFMRTVPFVGVTVLVVAMSFFGGHPGSVQVCAVLFLLFAGVLCAASYAERPASWGVAKRVESARSRRKTGMVVGSCVALTLSAAFTCWPLRLSYDFSKASLNSVAKQVASGNKIFVPQSTGVFDVYEAEIDNSLICLWIDEDRGEPIGFVRGTPDTVQKNFSGYEVVVLDNQWCLVNSL